MIEEIVATAAAIGRAKDADGNCLAPTVQLTLLETIERFGGCPSRSDVALRLRITRQSARELVVAAARLGLVELFPDPADRRTVNTALTPSGRAALGDASRRRERWVERLMRGLDVRRMRFTEHVLQVIRQRLQRDERGRRKPF